MKTDLENDAQRNKDGGKKNDVVDAKTEQRQRKSIGCSFLGRYLTQCQSKTQAVPVYETVVTLLPQDLN